MSSHIKVSKSAGKWSLRAGGAILGESSNALEVVEGENAPVVYFPRSDIAMAFLDKSADTSSCPHKGQATHYSIVTKSRTIHNAAWSYEDPKPDVAAIKGHLAFYPMTEVEVEQL
jgi:uncharacterized protein (DUF427 family)